MARRQAVDRRRRPSARVSSGAALRTRSDPSIRRFVTWGCETDDRIAVLKAVFGGALVILGGFLVLVRSPEECKPGDRAMPMTDRRSSGRGTTVISAADGHVYEFLTCWRVPGVVPAAVGGLLTGLISAGLPPWSRQECTLRALCGRRRPRARPRACGLTSPNCGHRGPAFRDLAAFGASGIIMSHSVLLGGKRWRRLRHLGR